MPSLHRFAQNERGSVFAIMAFASMAIIGAVGIAVDTGRAELAQSKLQNALDAGGLAAGATLNSSDMTAVVSKYLQANFSQGNLGATITKVTATLNADSTVLTANATATMPTTFMKIFGRTTMTLSATTEITRTNKGLELALVLDTTGSMVGSKLASLKTASHDLVSILFGGNTTATNLWIGVVPFTQAVNIGTSHKSWLVQTDFATHNWGTTSWAGCVDARYTGRDITDDTPNLQLFDAYYWPSDTNNPWITTTTSHGKTTTTYTINSTRGPNIYCPSAITPLTNQKSSIDAGIDALVAGGNTHVNLGAVWGWRLISPRWRGIWGGTEAADGDILAAFIAQFYQAHTAPPEILVNLAPTESALLAEALRINVTYGIDIRVPLRGDKLTLVNQAQASAEAALARTEMEQAAVRENLERLKEIFGLARLPQRIEVYDNSHTMGKDAVGAFIVATPEGFDKRSYRTFTIRDASTVPGDDYAMMREVFRRRFKNASLLLEGGIAAYAATPLTPSASGLPEATRNEGALVEEEKSSLPDLVLIDGGLGQLHAVQEALVGKDMRGVCFVGIAKGEDRNAGREWFFMEGRAPFQLPHNDPALYYLQRLRDEAHRFAIGRHRNKRSAALTASALDDIPGIGSGRKRALLQHFGSRADVERATITELEKVSGISKGIARSIYDFFHG